MSKPNSVFPGGDLPTVFYQVVPGVGFKYMAIRQVMCSGQQDRDAKHGGPCYIGLVDKVLWAGPKFHEKGTDVPCLFAKSSSFLTLDEAVTCFNAIRERYLKESQVRVAYWERNIAEGQEEIRKEQEAYAVAASFDIAATLVREV